jgi:hypothetical protein
MSDNSIILFNLEPFEGTNPTGTATKGVLLPREAGQLFKG